MNKEMVRGFWRIIHYIHSSKSTRVEGNKKGRVVTLSEKIDSMVQLVGDRGVARKEMNVSIMNVLYSMATRKNDEVTNAVTKLCTLTDLETCIPKFIFACTLIEDPIKRSILFGLLNDKLIVDYIKYMYELVNH